MANERRCLNCEWFVPVSAIESRDVVLNRIVSHGWAGVPGECRAHPPKQSQHFGEPWPLLDAANWCGSFKEKS